MNSASNPMSAAMTPPLWRSYLALLLPMLLTNALQLAAGTLDNIYLGHLLGTQAVAAAAAFFPVFFLLLALVMGLATGAMVLIGQAWGSGRPQHAQAVAGSAVALVLMLSALVMAVGGIFAPQLLVALGTPAPIWSRPSSMRASCCWVRRCFSCCGWPPPSVVQWEMRRRRCMPCCWLPWSACCARRC